MASWGPDEPGVLSLPSGRVVRGRGLEAGRTADPAPDHGLYLLARDPRPFPWSAAWVRWPDFRLPSDRRAFVHSLRDVYERSALERVEIACGGGRGRTGTALACLAVLDGVDPTRAVTYVRDHYDPKAVETPWQRRFVRRYAML